MSNTLKDSKLLKEIRKSMFVNNATNLSGLKGLRNSITTLAKNTDPSRIRNVMIRGARQQILLPSVVADELNKKLNEIINAFIFYGVLGNERNKEDFNNAVANFKTYVDQNLDRENNTNNTLNNNFTKFVQSLRRLYDTIDRVTESYKPQEQEAEETAGVEANLEPEPAETEVTVGEEVEEEDTEPTITQTPPRSQSTESSSIDDFIGDYDTINAVFEQVIKKYAENMNDYAKDGKYLYLLRNEQDRDGGSLGSEIAMILCPPIKSDEDYFLNLYSLEKNEDGDGTIVQYKFKKASDGTVRETINPHIEELINNESLEFFKSDEANISSYSLAKITTEYKINNFETYIKNNKSRTTRLNAEKAIKKAKLSLAAVVTSGYIAGRLSDLLFESNENTKKIEVAEIDLVKEWKKLWDI